MLQLPSTHANTEAPGSGRFDNTGVWIRVDTPPARFPANAPALFLDRDGVINVDVHYLGSVEDAELLPGAANVIAAANKVNIPVIVVTNQSGIGRDYLSWEDFARVQDRISNDLADAGAHWDMVLACAFHAEGLPPYDVSDHPGRKPNIGMILTAQAEYSLDLSGSWIIGDKAGDVECGRRAGLAGGVYAATHEKSIREEFSAAQNVATQDFPVINVDSVVDALPHIPYLAPPS